MQELANPSQGLSMKIYIPQKNNGSVKNRLYSR